VLGVVVLALTGCGYSLAGRGSFLPSYITVIGVPTFSNQTAVFDVEQLLTQRVRAEFIGRGKYRVVPDETGVDALLTGTITSITVTPAALNEQGQATRYAVAFALDIRFKDLKEDRVLWENPSLVFREEYEITTVTTAPDPAAFFGQASNALERIANDCAKSVVSSILEAF
jgi:hypothetical protein